VLPPPLQYLMGAADEVHVMFVEELCDHVGAEGEGHAAVVLAPAQHVLVGVGPEQVAQQALVRHVGGPHHAPHLLHGLEVRGQACGRRGQRSGTALFCISISMPLLCVEIYCASLFSLTLLSAVTSKLCLAQIK